MKNSVAIYVRTNGTEPELLCDLRRIVEDRGDVIFGTFIDDATIQGKGKNAAWRRLLDSLDQIDQIILNDPGDLPGRSSVGDVLLALATLTAHDVSLVVGDIDTSTGASAVLDLVAAYQRAKIGQAIKRGQERSAKRIGRPAIPATVRRRIAATLAETGGAIRATARRHNVSPAFVVSVKKSMAPGSSLLAA